MRQLIQSALEAKQDEWHDPEPAVYHAHRVWFCHRKNWYKRQGIPEEGDLPFGLFEMGHAAEDVVYRALVHHFGKAFVRQDLACKETGEVEILGESLRFHIVGKTDPGVFGFNLEPRILYESKSKGGVGKDPVQVSTNENYKMQGSWYASSLGFPELRIVHPGRQNALTMPVEDTVLGSGEIEKRAAMVREYFRRQFIYDLRRVPPAGRPFQKGECGFCPYSERCQADGGIGTPMDTDSYEQPAPVEDVVDPGDGEWIGGEEE